LGGLHEAILSASASKANDEAEALRARLRPLRERSLDLDYSFRGEGYDNEAYRVEQGEIGFSADKKIGTGRVFDCICIILRNPVTQKTALAHIVANTSSSSLASAFPRLLTRVRSRAPLKLLHDNLQLSIKILKHDWIRSTEWNANSPAQDMPAL
jgi:hypothetical protein